MGVISDMKLRRQMHVPLCITAKTEISGEPPLTRRPKMSCIKSVVFESIILTDFIFLSLSVLPFALIIFRYVIKLTYTVSFLF